MNVIPNLKSVFFRELRRLIGVGIFSSIFILEAFAATVACPSCQFQNEYEDRYCLECGAQVRDLTPAEVKSKEERTRKQIRDAFENALFHYAKTVKTTKPSRMHYEIAQMEAQKALSLGKDTLSSKDKVKLRNIEWECREKLGEIHKRNRILRSSGKMITIPLQGHPNAYYVTATINGKRKVRLVLDTGASATLIAKDIVEELDITKGPHLLVGIADGSRVNARQIILETLQVGDAKIPRVKAFTLPTVGDGLLGMSFLKHFKFKIDPETKTLILEPLASK